MMNKRMLIPSSKLLLNAIGKAFIFFSIFSPVHAQYANYGNAFSNPGSNDCFTITPNTGAQGGAVYNMTPINLTSSFRIRLFVNLGSNDGGADGMTFLMRSNPTVIPVGATGGSLGITGNLDSTLFVEMDTWDNINNNDVPYDHICIMRNDVIHGPLTNLTSPVMALPLSTNIEDGLQHELSVTWNAAKTELKVYFDCNLRSTYIGDIVNDIFNGNPVVYYGVTAATGGATNLQVACFSPGITLPTVINATCGDTTLSIQLTSKAINCSSVDADGTDFRLADSSMFNGTPGSVHFLPIKGAKGILCNADNKTDLVKINLWKPLHFGDYYLIIKKGNNQSSLSPFCSHPDLNDYNDFDVPEFTSILVRVRGTINVQIDDKTHDFVNPNVISVCLPQTDPFPLLKANSAKGKRFYWTYEGDTIQEIDSLWANVAGTYTVWAVDTFGCSGTDKVDVYFPTSPDFVFDLPPYCDTVLGGDTNNLPALLTLPSSPRGGKWEWLYDFGPPDGYDVLKEGDSLQKPFKGRYKLVYTDTVKVKGVAPCVTEYDFVLNRQAHPPDAPLYVEIFGNLFLCRGSDEQSTLLVFDSLLKPNFKPKPGFGPNQPYAFQWFFNDQPITGAFEDSIVMDREGRYSVFVKDRYGCVGADTVELKVVDRHPAFEVFCEVLLNGRGRIFWYEVPFVSHYEVSFDNGVNWAEFDTNSIVVDDIGSRKGVKVKAIFDNACKESDVSDFYPCAAQVSIPNVITPNGDGLNDELYIQALDFFPGSKIKVFDRWGNTVYESADYQNDWDGDQLVEGTYFYLVELNDSRRSTIKGLFTLLR